MEKQNYIVMDHPWKKVLLIGLLAALALVLVHATSAAPRAQYTYNNGRFGFGLTRTNDGEPSDYDIPMLNAGWYWDWTAKGTSQIPPLEYMQLIHLKPVKEDGVQIGYTATPTGTTLRNLAIANPGLVWMIGNEPDCVNMDNMRSEWYARAYHDLYTQLKDADPTAQIAAGNIVQPTPQRLMYLDRVLDTYQQEFGEALPADLWVTHAYILCEKCYPFKAPGEPFAWGACWVPDWPSYNASLPYATLYSVYDHWDIEIFKQRMADMRQWMYDNGYRNHPLLIAEYGVLFYDGLVYSGEEYQTESQAFMYAGFDWLRTARDPVLGFAPDDDRLVQRWAWYSLDHGDMIRGYGGSLFSPYTYNPTFFGTDFGAYTAQVTPTVDLHLLDVAMTWSETSYPIDVTVTFTVANAGNITSQDPITAYVYDAQSPTVALTHTTLGALSCCGDYQQMTLSWQKASPALQTLCIEAGTASENSGPSCITIGADIHVSEIWAQTYTPPTETIPVSATVYAKVANNGDLGTAEPLTLTFSAQLPGSSEVITIGETTMRPLARSGDNEVTAIPWFGYERGSQILVRATTSYTTTKPTSVTLQSDLRVTQAWAPNVYDPSGEPVTATLYAQITNQGNVDTLAPVTVSFYIPGGTITIPIGDSALTPPIPCCEAFTNTEILWPELPGQGLFQFCAVATTAEEISLPICNTFFVNPKHLYLPVMTKQ